MIVTIFILVVHEQYLSSVLIVYFFEKTKLRNFCVVYCFRFSWSKLLIFFFILLLLCLLLFRIFRNFFSYLLLYLFFSFLLVIFFIAPFILAWPICFFRLFRFFYFFCIFFIFSFFIFFNFNIWIFFWCISFFFYIKNIILILKLNISLISKKFILKLPCIVCN